MTSHADLLKKAQEKLLADLGADAHFKEPPKAKAYLDEVPPAQARYRKSLVDTERDISILAEAAEKRWRRLSPFSLVSVVEAANHWRELHGSETLTDFWDRLAHSIINYEFDARRRIYVVHDMPLRHMRLQAEDWRALINRYDTQDVALRRLAQSWFSLPTALWWCSRHTVPVPPRWIETHERAQQAEMARPRQAGRPSKVDRAMLEYDRRTLGNKAYATVKKESEYLRAWVSAKFPEAEAPTSSTIRTAIGQRRKQARENK